MSVSTRWVRVVWPTRSDPSLKLSVVITTLQVLGQVALDFKLSIAQILVSIGVCALIELAIIFRRDGVIAWPASGILTGNSVAFILRASGTRHGDWWSMHGIEYFVLAAVLSMAVKVLLRPGGRHLFNPSNVGIVWALVLLGHTRVFAQPLWWGPFRLDVITAYAVIVLGGFWILRATRMMGMALSFLLPFWTLVAVWAAGGRHFYAVWHTGAVSGASYWVDIALSPEVLVFVFFMMSDPQTAPTAQAGRVFYGALTGVVAAVLLQFQSTEFGIKLAILASLTVSCALVPVIDRRVGSQRPRFGWKPALAAGVIAIVPLVELATLVHNRDVVRIERRQTTRHPQ